MSAPPVKIKMEDEDEDSRPATNAAEIVDEDNLVPLTKISLVAKRPYPLGCPVCYNMDQSTTKKRLDACHGIVKEIYIDITKPPPNNFVYRVVKGNDISSEEGEQYVLEDKLSFAFNCPVKVKGLVENDPNKELEGKVIENDPNKELEGKVLFPKLSIGDKRTPYTIIFLDGGGNIRVEKGVDAELIKYNPPQEDVLESKMEEKKTKDDVEIGDENDDIKMGGDGKQTEAKIDVPDVQSPAGSLVKSDITDGTMHQDKPTDIEANNTANSNNDNKATNITADSSMPLSLPSTAGSLQHDGQLKSNSASSPKIQPITLPNKTQEVNTSSLLPGDNQTRQMSHEKRWAPPPMDSALSNERPQRKSSSFEHSLQSQRPENNYFQMTLPKWVTDSTRRNPFNHIIGGPPEGEKGYKTKQIELETGVTVGISHMDRIKQIPMQITLRPKNQRVRFDMIKAKEMVENILLDFVACDGAKARLLYELASTLNGGAYNQSGAVQQRCRRTNEVLWMILLDLPKTLDGRDLLSLKEDVQQRLNQDNTQCSVEVFSHHLRNLQLPAHLCKPFVLIRGNFSGSGHIERVQNLVGNVLKKYEQSAQKAPATTHYPIRPGQPDCKHYLRTGTCAFGQSCRFNHPPLPNNPQQFQRSDSADSGEVNNTTIIPAGNQTRQQWAPPPSAVEHSLQSQLPDDESQKIALFCSEVLNGQSRRNGGWAAEAGTATNFYEKVGESDREGYIQIRTTAAERGLIEWGRRNLSVPGKPVIKVKDRDGGAKGLSSETYLRLTSAGLSIVKPHDPESQKMSSRKRKSLSDTDSDDSFRAKRQKNVATYVLTVPSWVMKNEEMHRELFFHLIGTSGFKTKKILSETNCRITLSDPDKETRMNVTIESEYGNGADIQRAKRMIEDSLLEFLNDESSEGRLLYEWALSLQTNSNFMHLHKGENGLVRQDSHTKYREVWMKLLELPLADYNGQLVPHGKDFLGRHVKQELKAGTSNCSIRVYGFEGQIPEMCDPYVLVSGMKKDDVNLIADNVEDKLLKHQEGCHCKFLR